MNTTTILLIIGLVAISLLISAFFVLPKHISKRKISTINQQVRAKAYEISPIHGLRPIGGWEDSVFYGLSFSGRIPHWLKRKFPSILKTMYKNHDKLSYISRGKYYDFIVTMTDGDDEYYGGFYKRWHK